MNKFTRAVVIWVKPEENMARCVELNSGRKVYLPLGAQRPPFIQDHMALYRSFWPADELPLPQKGDHILFEEAVNVDYSQPTALVWCFQRDAFLAIHMFEMAFRVICPDCPHTMGDHDEFGECRKCNCGSWEEPDDLYAHGADAQSERENEASLFEEDQDICLICLQPEVVCTCDTHEFC